MPRGTRQRWPAFRRTILSATGQLWGNPLYNWEVIRRDHCKLWRDRVAAQMQRVDVLRIDHFRALAAYWSVPAGAPDARGGEWRPSPGEELMGLLWDDLGDLPIVAEDLGVITPDVEALRKGFGLPGMRVLQFGFSGDASNPHLPHMHEHDSVVYTGTHDNDHDARLVFDTAGKCPGAGGRLPAAHSGVHAGSTDPDRALARWVTWPSYRRRICWRSGRPPA